LSHHIPDLQETWVSNHCYVIRHAHEYAHGERCMG